MRSDKTTSKDDGVTDRNFIHFYFLIFTLLHGGVCKNRSVMSKLVTLSGLSGLSKKTVLKQSVGIDVSKDKIQCCLAQRQLDKDFRILSSHSYDCNASGFEQLAQWVEKHRVSGIEVHFLMEATGVYYEHLAYYLKDKGYRVSVLLPNKVKAYAKSLDGRSKTDVIDAKTMAQMAIERELPVWTAPDSKMLRIKRLCRERMELLSEKTMVSNRLHAKNYSHAPNPENLERSNKLIKFLIQLIEEIEQEVIKTIESAPDIKERYDKVCAIPGIGAITAATIIAETNGFTLFNNKAQLVCYAGYDVVEYTSGTSVEKEKRISKKGNGHIRRALHFPALVAVRVNEKFKNLHQRVLATTSVKMKAYVAVQRKLLVLIYSIYKNNVAFDPNYDQTQIKNSRQEQAPAYAA
jgi:transposase